MEGNYGRRSSITGGTTPSLETNNYAERDAKEEPNLDFRSVTGRSKLRQKRMAERKSQEALEEAKGKEPERTTLERRGKIATEDSSTDTIAVDGDLVLHFIDIGQGNCTFIQCPGGETILVDCGSKSCKELVAPLAREYIKGLLHVNRLDYLVISHPDGDHYNLLAEVLEGVEIKTVLCGGKASSYSGDSGQFLKELLAEFIENEKPFSESPKTDVGKRLIQCAGMDVWIVSANARLADRGEINALETTGALRGTEANTASVVLALRYNQKQVLICADATFSTEAYILFHTEWKDDLKSFALAGGHHGSAQSFSVNFLKAVNPSWVHFSADNRDRFRHPTWEVVKRVLEHCPNVQSTAEFGPHGVVIGPRLNVGLESQKKGQEQLIEMPHRVKAVLERMKAGATMTGKDALTVLLKEWGCNATSPESSKIAESWVNECFIQQQDVSFSSFIDDGSDDDYDSQGENLDVSQTLANDGRNESLDVSQTLANDGRNESLDVSQTLNEFSLNDSRYEDQREPELDTGLVEYWGDRFSELVEEQNRLQDLPLAGDGYYWDWAVVDFNLFTTLTTANLGVYWILTVPYDGDPWTDQA
ncbi:MULTISPECIES: ComEC/Rec2 family competence protein [Sorangium]|uniref:Metallo-beta-lactamase domain-containing protein n=1 Tax=Sorangium cellulosum TaxID=56 RepID=A0A4P2QH43_SORCE|nr:MULTISPECIES: MBL fold metallo-hydrolase [Sorangium]AUX29287.1 uncharacterized protein SOCE836_013750 [Sorangium cellulosum]WCQ88677.1 tail protein [Sorangium sp. Soce836]